MSDPNDWQYFVRADGTVCRVGDILVFSDDGEDDIVLITRIQRMPASYLSEFDCLVHIIDVDPNGTTLHSGVCHINRIGDIFWEDYQVVSADDR